MSMKTAMDVLSTMPTPEQKAAKPAPETKADNGEQPAAATPGAVEAKTAEAAPTLVEETPKAPATNSDKETSSKFAALAKRERAIVKQQQEFKSKESEYARKDQELAAREAKIKESESLWDTDVFKALELKGYDYKKLTDLMLAGQSAAPKAPEDPATIARKAIEDFKKEQAAKDSEKEAAAKKAADEAKSKQDADLAAAYESFRSEINEHIKTNEAEYELISLYGQQELVVETVQGYFDKHNKVLSIKEASEMVENYLLGEAQKAMKTKKLGAKTEEPKAPAPKETPRTASKTLNNDMTANVPVNTPARNEQDRFKRAMAALEAKR